jgi:microcystin-dependent protein
VPIETAPFINGLNASNPAASDGMNGADDHMRLTKAAILATFPNISGAVTASHTQLNSILSQLLGTTIYNAPLGTVGAPGYAFAGDLDTGWYSPAANRAALSLGGVDALNFASDNTANFAAGASFAGAVAITGPITGPGTTPIGGMIAWLSDTLPTGFGVWCWANGGTLNRTTAGSGKELYDEWSRSGGDPLRYGVGNGSTTFNVINMQEAIPVGKSTMGGASSPGLLSSISSLLSAALGSLFGADTHTLTTPQIPSHTHGVTDPGHTHAHNALANQFPNGVQGAGAVAEPGSVAATINSATTGISIQNAGGGGSHNNVQPSRVVSWIIRIA